MEIQYKKLNFDTFKDKIDEVERDNFEIKLEPDTSSELAYPLIGGSVGVTGASSSLPHDTKIVIPSAIAKEIFDN